MEAVSEKQYTQMVNWKEEQVITFPSGLPGFENARRFIILTFPEHEPFHWMESVDGSKIRFALINPLIFRPDYQPRFNKAELDSLNVQEISELLMYTIVTLKQPLVESTANLMGPLFVNIRERVGKQVIIENEEYSVRERILR